MNLITALDQLPLWRQIKGYQPGWLRLDLASGLSIAEVSLPSAIAYPAIAQLPIETGLFAAVFAMIGYALTGPSRQLMVGPDTATCIMLASVISALGATVAEDRALFAQSLAILVGVVCLGAGLLRFGMVANSLSRPMLVGFLIGISISLIIGQFTRLTGVPIESRGLLRPIIELLGKFEQVHIPTLVMALCSLLFIRFAQRLLPGLPAPFLQLALPLLRRPPLDCRRMKLPSSASCRQYLSRSACRPGTTSTCCPIWSVVQSRSRSSASGPESSQPAASP